MDRFLGWFYAFWAFLNGYPPFFCAVLTPNVQIFGWILPFGLGGYAPFSATVFELSSGEKQLIIMLAHIAFNYKNKNSSILIIDEPELSLHISWQELFVDALLKASPNAQYILATHAPAIIAHVERRDNCIDLTNMN